MSNSDTRNMYDLIRSAYAAKRNNNLQGVVINFKTDLARLHEVLAASGATAGDREVSDATIRRHPIAVLYSSHICQLTGSEVADRTNDAYEWCEHMLQQEILRIRDVPIPQDSN